MVLIPYFVAYAAIAVFFAVVLARIVFWVRMPMHVRWELYPVAHEGKKASYGGSYLETPKWWKEKRHFSLYGEIKAMSMEIFFLVALKESNPKMWLRSFPFHFGLYLITGASAVMGAASLLIFVWPGLGQTWVLSAFQTLTVVLAYLGLLLGLFGAIGLLHLRLFSEDLRDFTTPADIFNLSFFVMTFAVALLTGLLVDQNFGLVSYFMYNLVTFHMAALPVGGFDAVMLILSVILFAALLAYIPTTHMSHFIAKYFSYHSIRWDDKPNLKGGDKEDEINGLLTLPVSWKAEHIQGDGKKSWADVATEEMKK
jgi:nitrate reductase gamma subunit